MNKVYCTLLKSYYLFLESEFMCGANKLYLSFDVFIPSFSLAESPPSDLQMTAYK